jgi:WD40 repeat protein
LDRELGHQIDHLAGDLADAGRTGELRALLVNLDWQRRKLADFGFAALDEDLARLDADADVRGIRAALRASADALEPLRPANALRATILSRLPAGGPREAVLAGTAAASLVPRLESSGAAGGAGPLIARTIEGDGEVTALLSFPDGRRLLRCDKWGAAQIFDVELGELVASLPGGRNAIIAAALSPDGHSVAIGDTGSGLRLWSLDRDEGLPTGEIGTSVRGGAVECAFFPSGQRLATATEDGTILIWDLELRLLTTLGEAPAAHGQRMVGPLMIDPAERWLAAQFMGAGNGAHVWDLATGRLVQARADMGLLAQGGRGGLIVAHGGDVVGWDPVTGQVTEMIGRRWLSLGASERLRWHVGRGNRSKWISHTMIDPGGSWLARVDQLETTRDEAVQLGATLRIQPRHGGAAQECHIPGKVGATIAGPGGSWLAIGSDGGYASGEIYLWRPSGDVRLIGTHAGPVTIGVAGSRGDWLATADRHGTTRLWPIGAEASGGRPDAFRRSTTMCRRPAGADWFAVVDTDRTVSVADAATGMIRHELNSRERITFINGYVFTCVVSPDGRWLATADDDGTVYFWDPATGMRVATGRGHSSQVIASDAGPEWIATVDHDGLVLVWSPSSGRAGSRFELGEGYHRFCRADPSGRWLAVAGRGTGLHILFPYAPAERRVVTLPAELTALEVQGGRLLAGDASGGVHLIDPATWQPRLVYRMSAPVAHLITGAAWTGCVAQPEDGGHAEIHIVGPDPSAPPVVIDRNVEPVSAARPSPDGRYLATVSGRRTLRVWDPRTGSAVTGLRVDGELADVTWLGAAGPVVAVGRRGVDLYRLVL